MPEILSASVAVLGGQTPLATPAAEGARIARVLGLYAATLARSLNEPNAFEAAVHLYRSEDLDLPEEDARKAVANIICRKA